MSGTTVREILSSRWQTTMTGPFFETAEPPQEVLRVLPPDYIEVIREFGGREGFLGSTYIRLYRLDELIALNMAYQVPKFLPEILIFGANGFGDAYCFAVLEAGVFQVPLIPLIRDEVRLVTPTFTEFIKQLWSSGPPTLAKNEVIGKEVHAIQPLCLGGDPIDPANKVLTPVVKHAEVCSYWNVLYRNLIEQKHRLDEV